MRPWKRLAWRFLAGLGVLWGTATLVFLAINLTPGDTAMTILGGPDVLPTPAVLAQVRREYGLDKPLPEQYVLYLSRVIQGDLGESYRLRLPVAQAIGQQIGATATLAFWAAIVALPLAFVLALLTAGRARWIGAFASGIEQTIVSTPPFITGLLLLLAFSFSLRLFPASSAHGWEALILPVTTMALPITGMLTQVLRRELEDILEQPFITTVRARGASEAGVKLGHALRHALIPAITLFGVLFAALFASAIVVETVFNRQGIGRLLADATTGRDVPLVLGIVLLAALVNVLINIVVDFIYVLIDPRVAAE